MMKSMTMKGHTKRWDNSDGQQALLQSGPLQWAWLEEGGSSNKSTVLWESGMVRSKTKSTLWWRNMSWPKYVHRFQRFRTRGEETPSALQLWNENQPDVYSPAETSVSKTWKKFAKTYSSKRKKPSCISYHDLKTLAPSVFVFVITIITTTDYFYVCNVKY